MEFPNSTKDKAEYRICQRRGHNDKGMYSDNFFSWTICDWCGTHYRTETTSELVEK